MDRLTNPPEMYSDEEMMDFMQEFDKMTKLSKYTCLELLLSTCKILIENNELLSAQKYLVLIIPLSFENKCIHS